MRFLAVFIATGLGISGIGNSEAANEARCAELGANCICSEPMNTNTWTGDTYFFNPADTTPSDKQCVLQGNAPLVDGSGFRYQVATSGEMFNALPNLDASINYLFRTNTGGGNWFGHDLQGLTGVRRAARWYVYFSPTWELTGGACLNSGKLLEMGRDGANLIVLSEASSSFELYGWSSPQNGTDHWTTQVDCCTYGPANPGVFGTYTNSNVRGHWYRMEVVITNATPASSTPTVMKVYMRNVTDDTPEVTIIDTSIATSQPGDDWTQSIADNLHPLVHGVDQLMATVWRNGTCAGYFGLTHYLAAAWNTDSGQRIGAATEIEGGTQAGPDPPTNFRIIGSIGWLIVGSIIIGMLFVGGFYADRLERAFARDRARTRADLGASSANDA